MDKPVYLFGAGGHGLVVLDTLQSQGRDVLGIIDPALSVGTLRLGVTVLGADDLLDSIDPTRVEVAVGVGLGAGVSRRRAVFRLLRDRGFVMVTVLHPSAVVAQGVCLGDGCQVLAGAVLQPSVTIGDGAVVNTGATIDHDSRIGELAFVSPGATVCGGVLIESEVIIGAGATILPGVVVGSGAFVGAGAVVLRSVSAGSVVAGNPATLIERGSLRS
jgi:sugar O-acyltransferase (sialic acid O-acetyltransferase NeuD family)